jgi:hypothetical protein
MRAATEAPGQGAEVTILAKGPIRATHTRMSDGWFNAVSGHNPVDYRDILFSDNIYGGTRLNAAPTQIFPPRSARAPRPGATSGADPSREEAAGAMKEAGGGAIVASSFGPLFMRNCINLGVPVSTCIRIAENTDEGDKLSIDLGGEELLNTTSGNRGSFPTMAPEQLRLLNEGGLHECTAEMLAERRTSV